MAHLMVLLLLGQARLTILVMPARDCDACVPASPSIQAEAHRYGSMVPRYPRSRSPSVPSCEASWLRKGRPVSPIAQGQSRRAVSSTAAAVDWLRDRC